MIWRSGKQDIDLDTPLVVEVPDGLDGLGATIVDAADLLDHESTGSEIEDLRSSGEGILLRFSDDPSSEVVDLACKSLESTSSRLTANAIEPSRICLLIDADGLDSTSRAILLLRNIHELCRLGFPVAVKLRGAPYVAEAYKIDLNGDAPEDEAPSAMDKLAQAQSEEELLACELGANVVLTTSEQDTKLVLKGLRPYAIIGIGAMTALVADDGEEDEGRKAQINHAITQLCQLPDSQIVDISQFIGAHTGIEGGTEDLKASDIVYAAVMVRTGLPPKELRSYLDIIEQSLGCARQDGSMAEPFAIRLDILDYQLYDFQTPELSLPHPSALKIPYMAESMRLLRPNHVLADGNSVLNVAYHEPRMRTWKLG